MPILIRGVHDEHGFLGNMSPHPITWNGEEYRTSEALFQCLRFRDREVIEEIRAEKSPMAAKMKAKKYKAKMVVKPRSLKDLDLMRRCLKLKVEQHPELKRQLLETGAEQIIEDCSRRRNRSGMFWGAAFDGSQWSGTNFLGRIWMEIRHTLRSR